MNKNFKKKILKNGMTVLFEKRDFPVVSVAFAVRQGGINEAAEEKGISHYIEHMLYKGTKKRTSDQIAGEIEKNGGEMNGFTGETMTAFFCKMPSKHLGIALDVLGDVVRNAVFDKKELDKERKVIFEEIKMRRDMPPYYLGDKIQGFLYEAPLGLDLIGTEKTMNLITREKIVAKFKEVYQPHNMVLAVVGNVNFEEIVRFAEKNFKFGKGKLKEFKVKKKNYFKIEKRKGIDQANLMLAFHSPLAGDSKNYAAKVLSALMGRGLSSRLIREIRDKRNLVYSIGSHCEITWDYGYTAIYAGTPKEKVEEVKKLILEEFEKVANSLDEKELDQVKEQLVGNYHIGVEDSQVQLLDLLHYEIDNRNVKGLYEYEKNIRKVQLKEVKELASRVKEGNYSFLALVPE